MKMKQVLTIFVLSILPMSLVSSIALYMAVTSYKTIGYWGILIGTLFLMFVYTGIAIQIVTTKSKEGE